MQEERKRSLSSFFVTLTYEDSELPDGANVCKKDVQLFFKRLRKEFYTIVNSKIDDKKDFLRMKYMCVSEYGPNGTERPHYHMLIFLSRRITYDQMLVFIEHAWSKGFVSVSSVTDARIHYCTGYIINLQDTHGRVKPFNLYSKGLGISYVSDMSDYHTIFNPYYTSVGGYRLALPRYWKNKIYSEEERNVMNLSFQVDAERHFRYYPLEAQRALEEKKYRIFVKHKKH